MPPLPSIKFRSSLRKTSIEIVLNVVGYPGCEPVCFPAKADVGKNSLSMNGLPSRYVHADQTLQEAIDTFCYEHELDSIPGVAGQVGTASGQSMSASLYLKTIVLE